MPAAHPVGCSDLILETGLSSEIDLDLCTGLDFVKYQAANLLHFAFCVAHLRSMDGRKVLRYWALSPNFYLDISK